MSHRTAQPAGKRAQVRGGGGDASNGACVRAGTVAHALCARLKTILYVYFYESLD
jgi:hypothetical protein